MASLEESLIDILTGDVTLAALVGTRVEPSPLSQASTLPAISYQRISTAPVHTFDGAVGLWQVRMQFDVWGSTALGAQAVVQALHGALDHYRGTVAGVRIDGALSGNDQMDNDAESGHYRRILDYMIWSNI